MKAERVGSETLLARIVRLVAEAQRSRAPILRLADEVAGWFVPAVILVAIVTFIVWATLGPEPRLALAIVNAVSVLIIACPCALGLATPCRSWSRPGAAPPWAYSSGTSVDTLIFDKTGTLTEGKAKLVRVVGASGFGEEEVLRLAASLERGSEHPLATAILAGASGRGITPASPSNFQSITGKGIRGTVDGRSVALGNTSLLDELGIDSEPLRAQAEDMRAQGQTVMFVAVEAVGARSAARRRPTR